MDDRAEVISTPIQYALRYAAFGWPVFACRENDKRPIAQGGFHTASTDRAQVIAMWQQHPRANVGIPAGRSWWVLDVDPRHGGNETLAALEDRYGELPHTLTARTPSGGLHFYFAPDGRARNSANKLGPGLDTRGDGGYVLVEGSIVDGKRYAYQDWDPLTDDAPSLTPAPSWLIQAAFGAPKERISAVASATELVVCEGGRNQFLTRQGGRMRRMGWSHGEILAAIRAMNDTRCRPPLDDDEVQQVAASVARYPAGQLEVPQSIGTPDVPQYLLETPPPEAYAESAAVPTPEERDERPDGVPKTSAPQRHIVHWSALADLDPPDFEWLLEDWLSWHPTLLSGRGGVGKSLLAQEIATGIATGQRIFRVPNRPLRVLYWACEDDEAELWRRQRHICEWLDIGFSALSDNLIIDARLGLENTLFATEYGRPTWTPLVAELEQQVNDYKADVIMIDNIGQVFGANENDRHHVTSFVNGIIGLVRDRKFCPVFMGHPAKAAGSEYAGNAAWENAVRMRWFLSDRLPDEQQDEDEQRDDSIRYLCKRKANYSNRDYVRFRFEDRVLKPDTQPDENAPPDVVDALRNRRDETIVLDALRRIVSTGKTASDTPGTNYLPKQIMQFGLNEGRSKRDIEHAMRRLMMTGSMVRAEVGKYPNRTPKFGLVAVNNDAQS